MAARKKFIGIEIPLLRKTFSILGTPESLQGKTIKLDLTRELKGKSLEITFKIFPSKGTPAGANKDKELIGLPKKMLLMRFYIERMMRKRANYIEDSFKIRCADIQAIIKPFLITRKKVSRAVRKHLRNVAREFLLEYIKEKNYIEVCEEILRGEIQKKMLPKLKKIYPLSFSEIRIFETKELEKIDFPEKAIEIEKEEASKKSALPAPMRGPREGKGPYGKIPSSSAKDVKQKKTEKSEKTTKKSSSKKNKD